MKEKLRSKRSEYYTFVILIIPLIVILSAVFATFINYRSDAKTFQLFIVVTLFSLALFYVYYFIRIFPGIRIDTSGIVFSALNNSQRINWNDIEDIKLTGKNKINFLYFFNCKLESSEIILKNGNIKVIWPSFYRNSNDIRLLLHNLKEGMKRNEENSKALNFNNLRKKDSTDIATSIQKDVFSGKHLFSFRDLIVYSVVLIIIFNFFVNATTFINKYHALFSVIVSPIIMGLVLGSQLYYFSLNENYLCIKNSIWFWKTKTYELKNILEVVIEEENHPSFTLRIITKDYKSKFYSASSLSDNTWQELMLQLDKKGILVRNETQI